MPRHGAPRYRSGSGGRHDVDVELVPVRVSHPALLEALEVVRDTRIEPPAAQRLNLGGGCVKVIDGYDLVADVVPAFGCLPVLFRPARILRGRGVRDPGRVTGR
jgi:hypothetical protein